MFAADGTIVILNFFIWRRSENDDDEKTMLRAKREAAAAWNNKTLRRRESVRAMNEEMMTELTDARRKKQRIEALCERIARLRSCAEYTSRQLTERQAHDPTRDRLAEYVAELDELERKLAAEVIALEKRLCALDAALGELPPHHEQILRLRYCDGLSWAEVAKKTHYCERQCKRIGRAE